MISNWGSIYVIFKFFTLYFYDCLLVYFYDNIGTIIEHKKIVFQVGDGDYKKNINWEGEDFNKKFLRGWEAASKGMGRFLDGVGNFQRNYFYDGTFSQN